MLLIALSTGARAAEILVPHQAPTLAAAVALATADGDVILVDGGATPTLTEAEPIVIVRGLTIRGVGAARPVLRGGDDVDGLFLVEGDDAALLLQDVDLDGGGATRLARVVNGDLTLRWVVAYGHVSDADGGAIRMESGADAVLIDESELRSGTSGASGGLIAAFGGVLDLRGARLSYGTAGAHGGLVSAIDTALTFERTSFETGAAGARGGAVHVLSAPGPVDIDVSWFIGNIANADRGGGAIYAENAALTLTDSWFERNVAHGTEGGGALYLRNDVHSATRTVFCGNGADQDGGAVRAHDNTVLAANNTVWFDNTAGSEGGAIYVKSKAAATLAHLTASSNTAGPVGAPTPGQAAWTDGPLAVSDAYVADHAGAVALFGNSADDLTVSTTAFWENTGGDADPIAPSAVLTDPGIAPPALPCDPSELVPPPGSSLEGAGTNGSVIGAFGGPERWTDADADGWWSWADCDDDDSGVFPDAVEVPADGVDSDCDGEEACYVDADQDGLGEPGTVTTGLGLDCHGPGEADNGDDACPGFDDAVDADGDEVPDGCDGCPDGPGEDTDGDGVCDPFDGCPGFDDRIDTDGDGVPDGCDPDDPLPTDTTDPDRPGTDRGAGDDDDKIVAIAGCGCDAGGRTGWVALGAALVLARRGRRAQHRVPHRA